jgi:CubicO group peptidase (beta-lactamase class C family)
MLRRHFLMSLPSSLARAGPAALASDVPITGAHLPGLDRFDGEMLKLMRRHDAPGASLSIAKDKRLVYARGFGWAWIEGKVAARPETVFGLASVSKAITAIAVLKMVENGALALDDPAFHLLRWFKRRPGDRIDPRIRKITVRQLLNHSGGFNHNSPKQQVARAMDKPTSHLRERDVVEFSLGRPLDYDPGTQQHYSNLGFAVLGAVVESVAGEPYGHAVHRLVLDPLHVRHARLGHGEPYARDSARCYGPRWGELPPIDIAGGSAGGWMAPSVELVRLLAALHGPPGKGFLSPHIVREMLAPPQPPLRRRPNGAWFGLGWDIVQDTPNGKSYAKNGGMAGVRSFIGHTAGNIDWAVVFNGGTDVQGEPSTDADAYKTITGLADGIADWPTGDLFPRFT